MRDGGEDVEALMTWGGEGRIGASGGVEVEGEVFREDTIFKNVIEEATVAGSEPDRVVGEIGVGAVGAEID